MPAARGTISPLAPDTQMRDPRQRDGRSFQELMASFSHYYTVGNQIMEGIRAQRTPFLRRRTRATSSAHGRRRIRRPVDEYPFQLSGACASA